MKEGLQPCKLTTGHAMAGLRLSRLANWNQTLPDWECLLKAGNGFGFQTGDGLLVASMIALPLGPRHGWISMVLTDPDWRRRGLANQLMTTGTAFLESRGLIPTLDATPAGEKVYRAIGFSGDTGLARWMVSPDHSQPACIPPPGLTIRRMLEPDLDQVSAWDHGQTGCDRAPILRCLRENLPDLAHLIEDAKSTVQGYVMGRPGEHLPQIGPLVAGDSRLAVLLLKTAASRVDGPFYVDAFDRTQSALQSGLKGSWSRERGFKRLLKGASVSPENPKTVFLAAGPELS